MTRILGVVLLLGLMPSQPAEPPTLNESVTPELVVMLAPAEGVVPLDTTDQVAPYRFFVIALDRETHTQYGSDQVLVRLGQKRTIDGPVLRGSVDLHKDGSAKYSAEFLRDGKAIARTSATVRIASSK